MYKLIALDIDDTLLGDDLTLSQANKEAITAASRKGAIVTIATGRACSSALDLCKQIALNNVPIITFGGAEISMFPSGKILHEETVSVAEKNDCLAFAREHHAYIQCYDGNDLLYEKACEESRFYEKRLKMQGKEVDLYSYEFSHLRKCLISDSPEKIAQLLPLAKDLFAGRLNVMRSYPKFLEFFKLGVDKASALKWLANHLGIKQSEIIAIGDSGVDLPMIQYAGLGVAVENAEPGIKAAANYIAPSANDNGVAHVINKFILEE